LPYQLTDSHCRDFLLYNPPNLLEIVQCPQSLFGIWIVLARKQIELATCGLRQIAAKLCGHTVLVACRWARLKSTGAPSCIYDIRAPVDFSRAQRHVCSYTYRDGWIKLERSIEWPPASPDLNPQGFLPVATAENPCVRSSCCQGRGTSQPHCGCLWDYEQLPRHLRTDVAVRVEACAESHR
jgi:hypothetical protein